MQNLIVLLYINELKQDSVDPFLKIDKRVKKYLIENNIIINLSYFINNTFYTI